MRKRILVLFLMLTMICSFSACNKERMANVSEAAEELTTMEDGEVRVSYCGADGNTVVFENESYTWDNDGTITQVYSLHGKVPDNADLKNLPVLVSYKGTSMSINGAEVGTDGIFTGTIDFTRGVTMIRLEYGDGSSRLYYVAAYPSAFDTSVYVDYSSLKKFASLSTGESYTGLWNQECPFLDWITEDQINAASDAATQLSELDLQQITYGVEDAETCLDALTAYGNETGIPISGADRSSHGSFFDISVAGTDNTFGGTYTENGVCSTAGLWMCQVTRGQITITLDPATASIFYLMPGDVVAWSYSCNLGYDLGAPIR